MELGRSLEGRIVLVVGAGSSGGPGGSLPSNGEAAAHAYAAAGARVVAIDRSSEEAERVVADLRGLGATAHAVRADVTSTPEVESAVAGCIAAFGPPHVLHHNVGIATLGGLEELDDADWARTLDVNLGGAVRTIRAVLGPMRAAGRGVITTVSSIAAIRDTGYPYPAYAASKAALDQLTVTVALAHAREGIRANAILPGVIDTPLVHEQITDDPAALAARHALSPTGRMGRPQDVANVAVFLASDAAAYVNGVCLPVDGGLSARCG